MFRFIALKRQESCFLVLAPLDAVNAIKVSDQKGQLLNLIEVIQQASHQQVSLQHWCQQYWDANSHKASSLKELLSTATPAPLFPEQSRSHLLVTGTGLTHLGSQNARNSMHTAETIDETDSAKMFRWGVEGGKPEEGQRGVAPEWFYKGDASILKQTGQTLAIPEFAPDGGEEPEMASLYWNDAQGEPHHLGFALGNEWSDHQTEKQNYLYLAPSKLRECSIGSELLVGHPFQELQVQCTVTRDEQVIYNSGELLTGEQHMCHSLANCEDHHFKHAQHRQAGQCHVHFLGTSQLSFSSRDWEYQQGDQLKITSPQFVLPLVNVVERIAMNEHPIRVKR